MFIRVYLIHVESFTLLFVLVLKYAEIKQAKEMLCWQGVGDNIHTIKREALWLATCFQSTNAEASLRLWQQTFGDATTGFPSKWRLTNERRNSMAMMTRRYPDLGSTSDWLNQISHATRPIRRTTQIWVVTVISNGISALVSQKSFGGETSGSVAKCRLFSQATQRQANELWTLPCWQFVFSIGPHGFHALTHAPLQKNAS